MPRPQPEESPGRDLLKLLWLVVVAVLFIALAGPVSRFVGNFMAERFEESLPELPDPRTSTSIEATSNQATSTTAVVPVDAPPTFSFDCPAPGQGWRAAIVATQYLQDPVGYHTWYRVTGVGQWVYAGLFRSGLDGPGPVGGISAGVQVELRYGRDATVDPEKSEGYASFTTAADC